MKSIEGIILKKIPRKEADFVFEIYTKELGLAHFQAKSVRKHSAKLKSGLDVFNYVDLFYAPSKYMPIITDFKIRSDLQSVKKNLKLLKFANFGAYVIGKIFEPGLSDEKAWNDVSEYFDSLNKENLEVCDAMNSAHIFCYRLLHSNGVQPELDRCVRCGNPVLEENLSISLVNGGIIHYKCINTQNIEPYRIANTTLILSEGVLNLASQINSRIDLLSSNIFNQEVFQDFKKLTEILFQYHFGINISKLL
jgi:DNA repair protein RecO